ncbi:hypothetical protein [Sodalis-like endosymbiont of Proechinophthirus fluctus]|uniref:hypothetical protein n=1 Tax=Sodalis-like endosymbiont of Proechinophthirus fluctus TaxID=1462730 RepID=UPI0034E9739E
MFQDKIVVGVEVVQAAAMRHYMAEYEVTLSLGAIHMPKVLMHSGIGLAGRVASGTASRWCSIYRVWAVGPESLEPRLLIAVSHAAADMAWQFRSHFILENLCQPSAPRYVSLPGRVSPRRVRKQRP